MPEPRDLYFDSVTLSNFAVIGQLDFLTQRYRRRICVLMQVSDELTRGATSHPFLEECLRLMDKGLLKVRSLKRQECSTFRRLISQLGAGEAATIATAVHRNGIVVTDDLAARHAAGELQVSLTGTVGILRAAVRDGTLELTTANAWLSQMIEHGYRCPVEKIG
jgi:predicted nucleic acid-binding protein